MKQIVYTVYELFRNRVRLKKVTFSKYLDAEEYMSYWQKICPESTYYIIPHAKASGERVVW